MKNHYVLLIISIGAIIGIMILQNRYMIKENTLYSQSTLIDYDVQIQENQEIMTRTEAIDKVRRAFLEGLGIDLSAPDITMYINLYKETQNQSSYKWVMSWYDAERLTTYSCTIAASDGRILSLYNGDGDSKSELEEDEGLSQEEVLDIIEPFMIAIEIDWKEYELAMQGNVTEDHATFKYRSCEFINKSNPEDKLVIELDGRRKSIKAYVAKIGEEEV